MCQEDVNKIFFIIIIFRIILRDFEFDPVLRFRYLDCASLVLVLLAFFLLDLPRVLQPV